jgi:hypothetical protein
VPAKPWYLNAHPIGLASPPALAILLWRYHHPHHTRGYRPYS